jgi:hypothetical protein
MVNKKKDENSHHDLDRIMAKWLRLYEGLAEGKCPIKGVL